ncbi:MAG: polysaccharide biosynthesis/export family protein [Kiritimatiellales bacterium]
MKKAGIFFVLLISFVLVGCASRPEKIAGEEVGLYRLRPMDPVTINLLGIPVEKQIETVIDEKGNLTIPYINDPVKASGLTTSELERKIQQIYTEGQIYRNITVNVITTAKIYYVEGEVLRPQEYPLTRRITLMQAVAAAGGYNDYANRNKVTITRNGQVMKFDIKAIENHPERDVPVEAGDRIKVHRSIF